MPIYLLLHLLIISCAGWSPAQAAQRSYIVNVPIVAPPPEDFVIELLKATLNASKAADETIELRFANHELSQARLIAEVQRGQGNSMLWTITTKMREQTLRPIRVPLFKGLLGYRLLVIRKDDQALFAKIKSLEDLTKLVAGQGAHWPDTAILLANDLPVEAGLARENLYKMIAAKRFDYFPRGITETHEEAELIKKHDLMVEPTILLFYPTAMYFFVHKDNTELAERLEQGLNVLIQTGAYDNLFNKLPRVQEALTELKTNKRTVIILRNPDLPEDTKIFPPEYWIQ